MDRRLHLNMIVKNEAANLPRCLRSLRPYIHRATIMDTGSTDDTLAVIARELGEGIPYTIGHAPFEDFSQARNAALRLAREHNDCGYILLCDADMELTVREKRILSGLTDPSYAIMQDNGRVQYFNVRLLRRDLTCEYEGATHECITPPTPPHALDPAAIYYKDYETGANRSNKYVRDIELLTKSLREDPTNARSVFYMIQSLHGAGMIERAREFCLFRLQMEGLPEERYWTLFSLAQFGELLELPGAQIVAEYLAAYEFRPVRAEPLAHAASYLRRHDQPRFGLLLAREAAAMPRPLEVLPVDLDVYEWRALDEWLTCAVGAGNTIEARVAARKLLKRKLPDEQRVRIQNNCDTVLGKRAIRVERTKSIE